MKTTIDFLLRSSKRIHILYLLCIISIPFLFPSSAPDTGHFLCQAALALMSFGVLWAALLNYETEANIFFFIFFYELLGSILIRWLNISTYGDWLGYNPIDSALYRSLATRFSSQGYEELWSYLSSKNFVFDDFGYPTLLTFFFSWFGTDTGLQAMLVFNAVIIAWGAILLYRIAYQYLGNRKLASIASCFWGILPFGPYTAAAGLKENFFAFFVIAFFYSLSQYSRKGWTFSSISVLLLSLLGISLNRLPVLYISILAITSSYIIAKAGFVRKHLIIVGLFVAIVAYGLFDQIIEFAYAQKGYNDLNKMLLSTEIKMQETGNMFFAVVLNYLSALIGPFPNLHAVDEYRLSYITLYSLTGFLKCYLSFFFLYGSYWILKKRVFSMFPFLVFFLLHSVMLIITFYTLRDRFQWPHIPVYIIVSFWGIREYMQKGHKTNSLYYYTLAVTIMIVAFNLRAL